MSLKLFDATRFSGVFGTGIFNADGEVWFVLWSCFKYAQIDDLTCLALSVSIQESA